MSKSQLKKELAGFTADQLREIILDLYSAKKEAKDYLEFFLNPDVKKLSDNVRLSIYKELNRTKKRMLSPRWSKIRAMIKDFMSFKPGSEDVITLMSYTFGLAILDYSNYYVNDTYVNGLIKHYRAMLEYGDRNCVLDIVLPIITHNIEVLAQSGAVNRKETALELKNILETFTPSLKALKG